jgi:hypothetical protein
LIYKYNILKYIEEISIEDVFGEVKEFENHRMSIAENILDNTLREKLGRGSYI